MNYNEEIKIHFDLADSAGVLYFANLLKLSHQGLENLISKSEFGWNYWFNNPEFAAPIVEATSKFKKPMFAGETFTLNISLEEKGKHHLCFTYEFTKGKDLYATARTVHVFIDKKTHSKTPIPPKINF